MHGVYADTCTGNLACCNTNGVYWNGNDCSNCPSGYENTNNECFTDSFSGQLCHSQAATDCYKNCDPVTQNIHGHTITLTASGATVHYPTSCSYTISCDGGTNCSFACGDLSGLPTGATATGNWSVTYAPNDPDADTDGLVYNYSACAATGTTTSVPNQYGTITITTTPYTYDGTHWVAGTPTTETSCAGGYYLANSSDTDCSPVGRGYYSANGVTTRTPCPPLTATSGDHAGVSQSDCTRANVTFRDNRGEFHL